MTSKLLPTPTEISLVRLPNTFCIPPAFWILTILNKDERKDCVHMEKENEMSQKNWRLFVVMQPNIQIGVSARVVPMHAF